MCCDDMEEVQGQLFCVVCGEVDQSIVTLPTRNKTKNSSKIDTSHHREEEWKSRMLTDREYLDKQVERRHELEKAYYLTEPEMVWRIAYKKYLDWCFRTG